MGFTPRELHEAQERLKRERIDWEAKKGRQERLITKNNLVLEELDGKLERVSALVTEKTEELERLIAVGHAQADRVRELERQTDEITRRISSDQATLVDLDAAIASKQLRVDTDLEVWTKERRIAYEGQLKDTRKSVETVTDELAAVLEEVKAKRIELEGLHVAAANARIDHQEQSSREEVRLQELADRRIPLEGEIKGLEADVIRLERKKQVQIADTTKAKEQYDGFVDYEERARKVLAVKDRELQDKSQEIAEDSQHLQTRRSFLKDL